MAFWKVEEPTAPADGLIATLEVGHDSFSSLVAPFFLGSSTIAEVWLLPSLHPHPSAGLAHHQWSPYCWAKVGNRCTKELAVQQFHGISKHMMMTSYIMTRLLEMLSSKEGGTRLWMGLGLGGHGAMHLKENHMFCSFLYAHALNIQNLHHTPGSCNAPFLGSVHFRDACSDAANTCQNICIR